MKKLAQTARHNLVISWDNFDYSQTVRHQTLREQAKHISATTGKLCVGHYMPPGGLSSSMFHPETPLTVDTIYLSGGNSRDDISIQSQRYWIAEAIRYTHRDAVELIFMENQPPKIGPRKLEVKLVGWPEFPLVERLETRKTPHFGLGPILENEGTIQGTYEVIDNIFQRQLGLNQPADFDQRLHLVYGDQKTVSLIGSVKKERRFSRNLYGRYRWLLPIPGLFHWRTNFIDMIYDVYSGSGNSKAAGVNTTLLHNQNYLGCVQGHKSPFHHKEEVAMKAFDARITAMFYDAIRDGTRADDRDTVNRYIAKLSRSTFLKHVEAIRESVFTWGAQYSSDSQDSVDYCYIAHARFLADMETYKSLKYAIKHADIGMIERSFARSALLFHGCKKTKYAHLSLYMTWLTHDKAASKELRTAVLANGLVNVRGAKDGWFEMDRLNEFFNLQMKTLMTTRRSSNQTPHALFRRVALTASYCTDLQAGLEKTFGEYSNGRHQTKDASDDVHRLAYELFKTRSTRKMARGREWAIIPADILHIDLWEAVKRFNESWIGDEYINDSPAPPIAELDDIVGEDSDGSVE